MTESARSAADAGTHLEALAECPDCGLFQLVGDVPDGASAQCVRCARTLLRRRHHSIPLTLACTLCATLLFVFTLGSPLLGYHTLGHYSGGSVLTGPEALRAHGFWQLTLLVILTLIVLPSVKLGILLTTLLLAQISKSFRVVNWVFGYLDRISPWSMVEVFVIGATVAYARIASMARVTVGDALFAFGGVMFAMTAADASIDRDAIWRRLNHDRQSSEPLQPAAAPIACDSSARWSDGHDRARAASAVCTGSSDASRTASRGSGRA